MPESTTETVEPTVLPTPAVGFETPKNTGKLVKLKILEQYVIVTSRNYDLRFPNLDLLFD